MRTIPHTPPQILRRTRNVILGFQNREEGRRETRYVTHDVIMRKCRGTDECEAFQYDNATRYTTSIVQLSCTFRFPNKLVNYAQWRDLTSVPAEAREMASSNGKISFNYLEFM